VVGLEEERAECGLIKGSDWSGTKFVVLLMKRSLETGWESLEERMWRLVGRGWLIIPLSKWLTRRSKQRREMKRRMMRIDLQTSC
jgi:hypothetical protein